MSARRSSSSAIGGARAHSLERGDQIPHFDVATLSGQHVRYSDLWQHNNLVLVSVDARDPALQQYVRDLQAREAEFAAANTALVISTDSVAGLPVPEIVVADQWGEVIQAFEPSGPHAAMPSADELLEWIAFVRIQCPECPP